ncbi:MAG: hypothetical protein KC657_38975 [Myxococcales bacterium]|nr:hypothetical protein [Myxococcales bacterium]
MAVRPSITRFAALLLTLTAACDRPFLARDGSIVLPEPGGGGGASVLTANGIEYMDRTSVPTPVIVSDANEPWRAPIGFILPKSNRLTATSVPTVLATTGLAIVMRPSDTRVPSWGGEVLVRVDVIAPAAQGTARWGENVAIVIAAGARTEAAELVDAALGQLAGRDRIVVLDAYGARPIVPLMPASNRSMVTAAVRAQLSRRRGTLDTARALAAAGRAVSGATVQRVLLLSEGDVGARAYRTASLLAEGGVQVSRVDTLEGTRDDRVAAVTQAIPSAGDITFRDVRLKFAAVPAPSHVLEATGGDVRWRLDEGELSLGDIRAGEARTEVLRVTVPPWVPGEDFTFTVQASFDDRRWGGPRLIEAKLPCVYDDDIERIAESRHGDVIAYASAMATLRSLDQAFVGADVQRLGGLRRVALLHAKSMRLLARDTKDFAVQEQADMLAALLGVTR